MASLRPGGIVSKAKLLFCNRREQDGRPTLRETAQPSPPSVEGGGEPASRRESFKGKVTFPRTRVVVGADPYKFVRRARSFEVMPKASLLLTARVPQMQAFGADGCTECPHTGLRRQPIVCTDFAPLIRRAWNLTVIESMVCAPIKTLFVLRQSFVSKTVF